MVTFRHLVILIAAAAGGIFGLTLGHEWGGWPLGLLLGLIGMWLLPNLANMPWRLSFWLDDRRLRQAPTDSLLADLAQDAKIFGYYRTIRELRSRGHAMESELPRLLTWAKSESARDRYLAEAVLHQFFPAAAEDLKQQAGTA